MAEFDRDEIVSSAAAERPSLTGVLLLIYGLSLWSVWYWRGSRMDGVASDGLGADLELNIGDFGDSSSIGG